jgi:endonuclease/exonuclease/phosphatase family metal-dependent hydrolase
MPFLRRLIRRERAVLHTLYSGQPSTTPAVQGELFYGRKTAVPAFGFRDSQSGKIVRMFDAEVALPVESQLAQQGEPLLAGGSAYCNIYSGGADDANFCAATTGWGEVWRKLNPLALAGLLIAHFGSIVRVSALMVLELFIAFGDFLAGKFPRGQWWIELKYIPSRIVVSILLRELVTIGATVDVTRGLPVVQLNFLGYDEQSHRRNPTSAFAHWSLKGIDDSIRRVWLAARRSHRRDYDVWVYSDHGQEATRNYLAENGRTIDEAVNAVFGEAVGKSHRKRHRQQQSQRAQWLGGKLLQQLLRLTQTRPEEPDSTLAEVAAMGPLGHIYPREKLDSRRREELAQALVHEARVPLVLCADGDGKARAWTAEGTFSWPDEAARVLGEDHPFLNEVAEDLAAVCHHPNAGWLVISGFRRSGSMLTFALENGAHAGPGREETGAFALLPPDAPLPILDNRALRPLDLRNAALHVLGRGPHPATMRVRRARAVPKTVRIMTYNVHSCVGTDGKLSPARIARVIADCDPDIVALQELDVRRLRTGEIDQAHIIANLLEMEFHFHPALRVEEEQYGDAVFSRFPLKLVQAGKLPGPAHLEPRGALWASIDVEGRELQLLNTHLGLSAPERMLQIETLLGPDWLGHADCRPPAVLCGDFNALPNSRVYRKLCGRLHDAQVCLNGHRPQRTFLSRYPVGRIDYVFYHGELEVVGIEVPRTDLIRKASDHLPLIVEVKLPA